MCNRDSVWLLESGIFKLCTDVDASIAHGGYTDTVREATLEARRGLRHPSVSWRKVPESGARRVH